LCYQHKIRNYQQNGRNSNQQGIQQYAAVAAESMASKAENSRNNNPWEMNFSRV